MFRAVLVLTAGVWLILPSAHADPVRDAARDVAQCSELKDSAVRLACFDAAAVSLARALDQAATPAPRSSVAAEDRPPVQERMEDPVPGAASVGSDPDLPTWATAPVRTPERRSEESDTFTAVIVRITRNNVGRHRFYTDDGAVWVQTQIEEIEPPDSLPAEAEFRRRLTGNPTIKFDVSNRAYRVRREE